MPGVLAIDDSKVILAQIKSFVGRISDAYQVHAFTTGEEALDNLPALKDDLVLALVDFNMPGIDGIETIDRLLKHVPPGRIAMLTANVQDAVSRKALDRGVHYIAKPLNADKFRELFDHVVG